MSHSNFNGQKMATGVGHQEQAAQGDPATKNSAIEEFEKLMTFIELNCGKLHFEGLRREYSIGSFHIERFKAQEIRQFHHEIAFKWGRQRIKEEDRRVRSWYENELRTFVWVLFHYEDSLNTKISNFTEDHWQTLARCFLGKSVDDLKIEWLSLAKTSDSIRPWTPQEDDLLLGAIRCFSTESRWNEISNYIYTASRGVFFRKPKQCRERWKNYFDSSINKGEWTDEEKLTLLELVLKYGKKWSLIAKKMTGRTEHSVKNHYMSLLKKHKHLQPPSKHRLRKLEAVDYEVSLTSRILSKLSGRDCFQPQGPPVSSQIKSDQSENTVGQRQSIKEARPQKIEEVQQPPPVNPGLQLSWYIAQPIPPYWMGEIGANWGVPQSPTFVSPYYSFPVDWNHADMDKYFR